MVSNSDPSTPWKMAWQIACQSSSTSGGPHLPSPTSVVSMRHLLLRLPGSDPLPNHSIRKVCRELCLHHWPRLHVLFSVTYFHRLIVVSHDETSEAFHYPEPTSFLQALCDHLTGLSPSVCWFVKSLRALIKLSQTPCDAACARNTFASRWFMLSCMTKTLFGYLQLYCRRKPHTTNCIASSRVQKRPTTCSLQAGIGVNEGIPTTK